MSTTTYRGIKISALPAAESAGTTDQIETNQAGTTRRITLEQVTALVAGSETITDAIEDAVAATPAPPPSTPGDIALWPFLPLAGGTLTGALTGTSATFEWFSSNVPEWPGYEWISTNAPANAKRWQMVVDPADFSLLRLQALADDFSTLREWKFDRDDGSTTLPGPLTAPLNVNSDGVVGWASHIVNTGSPGTSLTSYNYTDPPVEPRANWTVADITLTADSSVDMLGAFGTTFLNPQGHASHAAHNAGTGGGGYGNGPGTVDWISGVFGNAGNQGAGTVTNACDFYARIPLNSGGGGITNHYAFYQQPGTAAGIAYKYGFSVDDASIIGGGGAVPTAGYLLDVRGPVQIMGGGSSAPPASGSTPGAGMLQRWEDNSGATCWMYGNGGSGYQIQVTATSNFAFSFPLVLQPNGGNTNIGGPLTGTTATFSGTVTAPGAQIQMVSTQTGAMATGTTVLPVDNTIPQITEGTEFMTCAITPKSATSKLVIEVVAHLSSSVASQSNLAAALFQDSTANALATGWVTCMNTGVVNPVNFKHVMTSGTTSAITFRLRAGIGVAGTITFNGSSAAAFFGGVMASSIVIREVAV